MATSLQARVVFPVDQPPIEYGVVTIDGEQIVDVRAGGAISRTQVEDLGSVALLPGLINTHTHLEFSDLVRPLGMPGIALADWLPLVIAERKRRRGSIKTAISAGLRESVSAGVTTIGEITTSGAAEYADCGPLAMTLFVEVIGFSRTRAASALGAAVQRIDDLQAANAGTLRSPTSAAAQLGISPHAPYSVSPDLLDRLIELASRRQLPVAMHLAESADELELLSSGTGRLREMLDALSMWDSEAIPTGSRPLAYLERLAGAPRALVVHGNFLDAEERAYLATHRDRMTLVYCPRTHRYFEHVAYPLNAALRAGVRVAIGTDSRASNPDLSVLAELRHVAQLHPDIRPGVILTMGTLSAAEALGRETELGSITPGKLANLLAVPLPADALTSDAQLASLLSGRQSPTRIWVKGRELPQQDVQ